MRFLYRRVIWRDKQGRRCHTWLPFWRTRLSVARRPEFGHWLAHEEKRRVWRGSERGQG